MAAINDVLMASARTRPATWLLRLPCAGQRGCGVEPAPGRRRRTA